MKIEVVGGMKKKKKKKRPKRKVEKGKRAEFGAMHAILEPAAEIIDETVKGPGTQDQWNPSDMLSAGFGHVRRVLLHLGGAAEEQGARC